MIFAVVDNQVHVIHSFKEYQKYKFKNIQIWCDGDEAEREKIFSYFSRYNQVRHELFVNCHIPVYIPDEE